MTEQEQAVAFDHELSEGKRKDQKKSVFEFRDVCFSVKSKGQPFGREKKEKIINHNISARVESGHVLAILGPSGAGKTTLINALSLNAVGLVAPYIARDIDCDAIAVIPISRHTFKGGSRSPKMVRYPPFGT